MTASLPTDANGLVSHADAVSLGRAAELLRQQRTGEVRRIGRGVYTRAQLEHGARGAAQRYRERVLAAGRRMRDPVFTSYSAAALHRLPLVGRWPEEIYVMSDGPHGRRRGDVVSVARRAPLGAVRVAGQRATPPAFTLVQLARHAQLVQALVAADAAAMVPRSEGRRALITPEQLVAEYERLRPFHGSRRVRPVLDRVTTLAETPLETLSRLVIEQLGFAMPVLQQHFWLPALGRDAYVDFYWPDVGVIGEADGHGKYLGAGSADGAAQRVIEEKQREDELREQSNGFARWGWSDAWHPARLEAILLRAGVPRPGPRRVLV